MSKFKDHHPFCNFFMRPIEECPVCDMFWAKYPIDEDETTDEMVKRYFPNVIKIGASEEDDNAVDC